MPLKSKTIHRTQGARQPGGRAAVSRATAVLAAGCLISGLAGAQSLPELYEAARSYDAAYLAAKAQADSVRFRAEQAQALRRPSVDLNASAGQAEANSPPVPPADSRSWRGTSNAQADVTATQWLYNAANSASIDQAYRALDIAGSLVELAEQDLIVRVAQAYFDVLAAQDSLGTAKTSKRAIGEQLASAKRNFEVGTATITDTREAQARFDLANAQELAAENELQSRRITLESVVGRSNITPKALAVPVALPKLAPADVNSWANAADEVHPAVRKARLDLEVARLETEKARATDGPTLALRGSVASSYSAGSAVPFDGNTVSASVGVQFKMPLYSGGQLQNRVKETLSLEEKSRSDLDAARRLVAQNTRTTFFNLNSLQAQVKAFEAAESSSQLALEATQLGYKVGVRVNLDVLNAQTQLFTTQRDLAKARYDVVLTGLKLRQASGQLKPDDVNAVNRLFRK